MKGHLKSTHIPTLSRKHTIKGSGRECFSRENQSRKCYSCPRGVWQAAACDGNWYRSPEGTIRPPPFVLPIEDERERTSFRQQQSSGKLHCTIIGVLSQYLETLYVIRK